MGLFGNLLGQVMGGGGKPRVPEAPVLADSQQKAIAANLEALPGAEDLVSKANAFTQDQISNMLRMAIPNYGTLTGTAGSNIESMLKGEIPKDVQNQIAQSDAAKALGGGYGGTGFHGNLLARDLGLTSLELTQRGLTAAESWLQMMNSLYSPGMISVASMFINPMQQFAADENAWGVQWLKNQIKAMPDPFGLALGQFIGGIGDAAASYFVGSSATQPSPSLQTPAGGYTSFSSSDYLGGGSRIGGYPEIGTGYQGDFSGGGGLLSMGHQGGFGAGF